MSLSWLDQYRRMRAVFVGVHAVDVETTHGQRLTEAVVRDATAPQPAWQATVDALARLLAREKDNIAGRPLRLLIDNAFVRYVVVPWSGQTLNADEYAQWTRTLFEDRDGQSADGWLPVVEPVRFGKASLAAAVPAALIDDIGAQLKPLRCRIGALPPAAIEHLNQHRRQIDAAGTGWFVDVSDTRLVILTQVAGEWVNAINEPCAAPPAQCAALISASLRRDTIRWPLLATGKLYVHGEVPGTGKLISEWAVHSLPARPATPPRAGERVKASPCV